MIPIKSAILFVVDKRLMRGYFRSLDLMEEQCPSYDSWKLWNLAIQIYTKLWTCGRHQKNPTCSGSWFGISLFWSTPEMFIGTKDLNPRFLVEHGPSQGWTEKDMNIAILGYRCLRNANLVILTADCRRSPSEASQNLTDVPSPWANWHYIILHQHICS